METMKLKLKCPRAHYTIFGGNYYFYFLKKIYGSLTKMSKFLSYCLLDCKDIHFFSYKPPFKIQTYPQSSIKTPGEEENRSTSTASNRQSLRHFSFKLRVHFDKWIGRDLMATALTSNGMFKNKILIVAVLAFLAIFEWSLLRLRRPSGSYCSFFGYTLL